MGSFHRTSHDLHKRPAFSQSLDVLDPKLTEILRSIVELATQLTGCKAAWISLVIGQEEIIRATSGFPTAGVPDALSKLTKNVLAGANFTATDLLCDTLFQQSNSQPSPVEFRFYAGVPLCLPTGCVAGSLSVVDTEPRSPISTTLTATLTNLAKYATSQIELESKLCEVSSALASLEDSEVRFQKIADASPVLMWISDEAGNRTLSNKAWCDFTGMSQNESLAECWRISLHPSDTEVYKSKWKEVAKQQIRFQHEYRLRHVSGTYRWVMEQAMPLFSSTGRLEAYVSSCVDLSLRNSNELQYQHNEARFRAISEAAPLGIVVTDSHGNCIYSNQRFQTISGLSMECCLGSGWLRPIHPNDFPGISDAWAQANKTAQGFDHTLRYQRPDGSVAWCSLKAAAINTTDTVSGWVSTIEDITAKRQAENELIAAKQAAETAMHAKSQFLANMSHEIRTPLTAIIGFADVLLEETALAQPQRHCIDVILNNGRHLLSIINQILDLAKIDAGVLSIERAQCAPIELLDELRLMFTPLAAEKQLLFDIRYEWPLPQIITSDPLRLKQVLINLIGNAIKFTSQGQVTVCVSWDQSARQMHC